MEALTPSPDIARLRQIMRALRDPHTGCPWDQKQDFASIAPYTVEEAYEVVDAIERRAMPELCDELGDLLLQVVFHAQMAEEIEAFAFEDVVLAITSKMIRRHPHVFGDARAADAIGAKLSWNQIKAEERAAKAARVEPSSVKARLDDVPKGLPSLSGALKLQQRAAEVGFDWSEAEPILDKMEEEIAELREAMRGGAHAAVEDECGDVLFSIVNLCRHLRVDPEAALRRTNGKFRSRFGFIERELARGGTRPEDSSLEVMEALWQRAKAEAD